MKSKFLKIVTIITILNLIFIIFSKVSLAMNEKASVTEVTKVSATIDDIINQGDGFVSKGENNSPVDVTGMKKFSNNIYNILLAIGMITAVIIGIILGMKFIMSTVEEKVKIKEKLIAYAIGCIVLFGAFGIWKMIIMILEKV